MLFSCFYTGFMYSSPFLSVADVHYSVPLLSSPSLLYFQSNSCTLLSDFNTAPKKATIQQVTTMLATSKNVLFQGHNQLLTTGNDELTLYRPSNNGYDLEIEHF